MKRKLKSYSLILLLFCSQYLQAQNLYNIAISGIVCDSITKDPIAFCTVLIVGNTDSSLVSGTITNEDGKYKSENMLPGLYKVKYRNIGYKSKVFLVSMSDNIAKDTVFLVTDTKVLNEVSVTASIFERDIDKLIMNTSQIKLPEGSTAVDMLKEVPGAYISHDNNITLLGKDVRILLDDKPIRIPFDKLSAILRNQSSSDIGQIEIMFSPPPKYIDEWDGPMINIISKKKLVSGFYGTVSNLSSCGKYLGDEFGLDLNYRSSSLNAFISFGPRSSTTKNIQKASQTNIFENQISLFSDTKKKERTYGYYVSSGLGIEISKKSSVDITYNGNLFKNMTELNDSIAFYSNAILDTITISSNEKAKHNSDHEINLFYRNKLDDDSHYISIEGDFSISNVDKHQDRNYKYFNYDDWTKPFLTETNRDLTLFKSKILFFRIDHTIKVLNFEIESGLKFNYSTIDNKFTYEEKTNNIWINNTTKSNYFSYNESILSGYLSVGQQLTSKFGYLLSLRGSYTWQNGYSKTIDSYNKNNYIKILPSVFINYKINDNNEITLNYDSKINRPFFETLNPFSYYDSPAVFTQGNQDLIPAIKKSLKIMHRYKSFLFSTINYDKSTNDITLRPILNVTEDKIIGYKYDNFGSSESFRFSSTYSRKLLKNKIRIMLNPIIAYSINDDKNFNYHKELFYYTAFFNADLILNEKSNWRLSFYDSYMSGRSIGFTESERYNKCGISMSRSFLHNSLSLGLDLNDIFNAENRNIHSVIGNVDYRTKNIPDSRYFRIMVSYSFSKKKLEQYNRHEITNEEKDRIN